jgi:hypothetical protein
MGNTGTSSVGAKQYLEKFVAFIDILGFSDLVGQAEREGSPTIEYLLALTEKLGTQDDRLRYAQYGPTVCPHSRYLAKDLGFQITQISDCVVVSAEISPAGVINLLQHCFGVSIDLLITGHLCRGYITRGKIFHSERQFMGTAYQSAAEREKSVSIFQLDSLDRGTPFIQIDESVCEYVKSQTDPCVNEMFRRMTESDGSETAISPFPSLKKIPSAVIDSNFNPSKFKASIETSRANILKLLGQLDTIDARASDSAKRKIAHYRRKLREVLAVKEKELVVMDQLSRAFSCGTQPS